MGILKFSGHETFHCRHFWLKKGSDYAIKNLGFTASESVVELGVGKNMVSAIHFWLKAYGIKEIESDDLTEIGNNLFGNDGFDPYIEDTGTLWLLQYYLIKVNYASIYRLFFTEFRKTRIDNKFTKENLYNFLKRKCFEHEENNSQKTLENDIKVFLKNYVLPQKHSKSVEDDFSALFIDLSLINQLEPNLYHINLSSRADLPDLILLYVILDHFENQVSITFSDIRDLVSNNFLMNIEGLDNKISNLVESRSEITYKEDAGRKELQFKKSIDKNSVLSEYYEA